MAVKLVGDSACDISQREAKGLNIPILPLKTLIDGVTITPQEFYDRSETCKELPTTSQLSPAEFEDAFQRPRRPRRHRGRFFRQQTGEPAGLLTR